MMLALRLAFAILFGACVVWSQTYGEPESSFKMPVPEFPQNAQQISPNAPLRFTLNIPEYSSENRKVDLAVNLSARPGITFESVQPLPPQTLKYSKGYFTRRKIHKYASIATLPLVISEAIVGQKLMDDRNDDSLRSAHSALAAGIGVLFGIESVTGVWNMWEARKNPNGRGKRLFHGILMLAADAGFVATAATAPHHEDNGARDNDASAHRAIAYTSFGVAAVSYVYMLFAK